MERALDFTRAVFAWLTRESRWKVVVAFKVEGGEVLKYLCQVRNEFLEHYGYCGPDAGWEFGLRIESAC